MPYANNLIYIDSSVTPPLGVSVYDVQRALGTNKIDVGSLCLRPNINMWARYKPIKYASVQQLTSAQWTEKRYGVGRSTSLPLIDNNGRLNHDVWNYDKPTGGASSPYRLTDFARYYHVAPCPVRLIFPGDVITLNNTQQQDTIGFVFTFEQGIGFWRSDDCCLYMRDIFSNSLNRYLTVGLLHYISGNYVGYFKSSDYQLSHYVASAQQLSGSPVATVLIDLADFNTKITQTDYKQSGVKWQAVMFLCDSQLNGATSLTTGTTELLQYDGTVTQDADGYENGCDRHIMTIQRAEWAGKISGMTITTVYERQGSSKDYKVSQMTIVVDRSDSSQAWSLAVELEAICVGGVMEDTQQQTTRWAPTGQYVTFAAGATQAQLTLGSSIFTGRSYQFSQLGAGNVCRAVLSCILKMSSGEKSIATDCDCSAGTSSYTITNSI